MSNMIVKYLVMSLIMSLIIIGLGMYIKIQSSRIETLNEKLDAATTTIVSYEKERSTIENNLKEQKKIDKKIVEKKEDNTKKVETLRDTLDKKANGEKRDLDNIANRKTTLLEKLINDATKEVGINITNVTDYSIPKCVYEKNCKD